MSTEVKWIKIATDIFDDEKILLIESMPDADALIVIWLKLLVQAGKCNTSGVLIMNNGMPYTDEMLATLFRRPLNTVRLALTTFEKFGMVEFIDEVIALPNWGKHQSLDQIEKRREYMKSYMRKKRKEQKKLVADVNETGKVYSEVYNDVYKGVYVNSADKDKDKELDSSSKLVNRLSEEESEAIFSRFKDADYLINEVQEQVDAKRKKIEKPYEYIVGYATNKGWETL